MVSFGISIILQNALLLIFTPDARSLKTALVIKSVNVFDFLNVPLINVINFGVGLLVLVSLHQFMKRTYLGWAIHASSDDLSGAKLMGINPNKIYALSMGIAAVTANASKATRAVVVKMAIEAGSKGRERTPMGRSVTGAAYARFASSEPA